MSRSFQDGRSVGWQPDVQSDCRAVGRQAGLCSSSRFLGLLRDAWKALGEDKILRCPGSRYSRRPKASKRDRLRGGAVSLKDSRSLYGYTTAV